jgi:DNA-binding protein HU-beta
MNTARVAVAALLGLFCLTPHPARGESGKPLSQTRISEVLAERTGLTRKQIDQVLDEQARLACEQAGNGYVVRGIGKLVLVDQQARTGRNPQTGEPIQIPARKAVKFRIAKSCKDTLAGSP